MQKVLHCHECTKEVKVHKEMEVALEMAKIKQVLCSNCSHGHDTASKVSFIGLKARDILVFNALKALGGMAVTNDIDRYLDRKIRCRPSLRKLERKNFLKSEQPNPSNGERRWSIVRFNK